MTRHPVRWDNLVLGVLFLGVVATWAVWDRDLLTGHELSLTVSIGLITLGVVGVAATIVRSRPRVDRPSTTDHATVPERSTTDEEADPQP